MYPSSNTNRQSVIRLVRIKLIKIYKHTENFTHLHSRPLTGPQSARMMNLPNTCKITTPTTSKHLAEEQQYIIIVLPINHHMLCGTTSTATASRSILNPPLAIVRGPCFMDPLNNSEETSVFRLSVYQLHQTIQAYWRSLLTSTLSDGRIDHPRPLFHTLITESKTPYPIPVGRIKTLRYIANQPALIPRILKNRRASFNSVLPSIYNESPQTKALFHLQSVWHKLLPTTTNGLERILPQRTPRYDSAWISLNLQWPLQLLVTISANTFPHLHSLQLSCHNVLTSNCQTFSYWQLIGVR